LLVREQNAKMSDSCGRCGKAIYAAEKPTRVPGNVYHDACFKCKECNLKLSLKTCWTEDAEIYCNGHKPYHPPNQVVDSTIESQLGVPDSRFGQREFAKGDGSTHYGMDGVAVNTATNAPKPPTNVQNVNLMEVRHSGETNKFG